MIFSSDEDEKDLSNKIEFITNFGTEEVTVERLVYTLILEFIIFVVKYQRKGF